MKETKEKPFQKNDLYSGSLAEIITDRMLVYPSLREKFKKTIDRKKTKLTESFLDKFQQTYGFKPGKEILEWENARTAYAEIMYNVPDIWNMIDHGSFGSEEEEEYYDDYKPVSVQDLLKKKDLKSNLEWMIGTYPGLMFLLNGSYQFASDGGGDTCWINLLPNEKESVEVNRYNHEIGELEDDPYYSISHFIASNWMNDSEEDEYDDDYEDEDSEGNGQPKPKESLIKSMMEKSTLKNFEKEAAKIYEKKSFYTKSLDLFERSSWLLGHSYGDPAFAFAEKLATAPSYKNWEEEKELINEVPTLAAYWILAHFFMKNDNACREACQIAKSTSGKMIPLLADLVLNYLNCKSENFNNIPSKKIEEIRNLTFRNSDPKHIEPQNKKLYSDALGLSSIKTLSKKELEIKLKNGEEPLRIMSEFPEDVATHDLLLKEIGKNDPDFSKLAEEYFKERTDDSYNEWPYRKERLDQRLSLPVSAAFRQGLKYDSDNKKSFCGITRTLGKFDDDHAMAAFRDAVQKLKQDDPRLEYVVSDLISSEHEESHSILAEASWKVFSTIDSVLEKKEKVAKEGPNLNNIFTVYSHLTQALQERILVADEESAKLCDKVLSYKENLNVFGISIGYAFAVSAKLGLKHHLETVQRYLQAGVEIKGGHDRSSYLDLTILINLSEAAIAWVNMDPISAKQGLYELFALAKKNDSPSISIDLQACLLSGLLLLEPEKEDWLELANRILGNRGDQVRVYGPIRAIGKAKIQSFKQHLIHHIYADPKPMVDYSWTYIEHAARITWEQLTGENAIPYDDSDQYASSVSKNPELLPEAILHPEKYSVQHVFAKIKEKNFKHEDVIKYGGPWLLESLRYSLDEYKYAGEYDRWEAVKALFLQGRHSLTYFAQVLDLPYASPSWKLHMLQLMRVMEPEARKWEKVISMTLQEIRSILENPSFDWIAWIDLLCVRLYLSDKENSFETILGAVKKRLAIANPYSYASYAYEETLGMRLPQLLRWFGKKGDDCIEKLWQAARPGSEVRTYLDEAAKAKLDPNQEIPKLPEVTEKGIYLTDYLKGGEYGIHFWIHTDDSTIKFGIGEFHLQGILKDSKSESSFSVPADEREEKLNAVWQMAYLLGYTLSAKKQKKTR